MGNSRSAALPGSSPVPADVRFTDVNACEPQTGPGISRVPPASPSAISARWVSRLLAAFLLLGVAVRLNRYLLCFPLWGDEACLAANFINRGYAELLRPLDYYPVAPVGFLWLIKTVVNVLGFNEYTLRLLPAICGLLSVPIFYLAARKMLSGVPLLLSTGIFAVAYYPIRHGAEIKQYSSDLFVSLVLLWLALGYLARPRGGSRFWLLCLFVPPAIAVSHPAVFVAGGIAAVLLYRAVRIGGPAERKRFLVYCLLLLGSFAFVYLVFIRPYLRFELEVLDGRHMFTLWARTFPPLDNLGRFLIWMIRTHTGRMFAYPAGAENGGSILTFIFFLAGMAALRRRKDRQLFCLFIAPFVLAFAAAALRRYPYGYSARWMLYLAPFICLPAGLGADRQLSRIGSPRRRKAAAYSVVAGLALIGAGTIVRDLVKPYKTRADWNSREFARSFWGQSPEAGGLFCLKSDLGEDLFPGLFVTNHNAARYLCNREICYPARARRSFEEVEREWGAGSVFNLVVYSVPEHPRDEKRFRELLAKLETRAELSDCRTWEVNLDFPIHREKYEVYKFTSR